jgi:hypothetical protein
MLEPALALLSVGIWLPNTKRDLGLTMFHRDEVGDETVYGEETIENTRGY